MNVITISNVDDTLGGTYSWDSLYTSDSLKLSRSLSSLNLSEVTIKKRGSNIISYGDYIKFYFNDIEILGRVFSSESKENAFIVQFSWGLDFYQRHIFLADNSVTFTNFLVNPEVVNVHISDTFTIISTDGTLYSDQICRQAMRKKHYREYFIQVDNPTWGAVPSGRDVFNVRLDDPALQQDTQVIEFSDDTINELTLYHKDGNTNPHRTYYLELDGSVVETGQNAYIPRNNEIRIVEANEWNDLQFAKDILLKQEYNNNIEIVTKYPFMGQIGIDELLGLRCTVWHMEKAVETFISEYEIKNNELSITFGLANTNLVRMLKGD